MSLCTWLMCSVQCTETEIMSVADAIVSQGLDKLGYKWVPLPCGVYTPPCNARCPPTTVAPSPASSCLTYRSLLAMV